MKTVYLSMILSALAFVACTEKELVPISASLGKPGVVTDIVVESVAGGAVVSYKIPNSEDLLSVKGVYTLTNGKEYEVTASYFENKIEILGYNDTNEHSVQLYAINRAQELSEPVTVKFTPEESPISKAIKSVKISPDFGGARFTWNNPEKAPLNVEFMAPDTASGQLMTMKILTTEIDSNYYSVRGYDPELTRFSMIISDNYDNYSDTLSSDVIPMFEEEIPKKGMQIMKLASDANFTNWEGMDNFMIDDDLNTFGHSPNNSIPAAFTVDLGCTAKLSRFVMHQRFFNEQYYIWGNPRSMEVWTCDHKPSSSGDWNEWEKIMDADIIKPSGSPYGTCSDLDMEHGRNGHEFTFPLSLSPKRYVRIRVTSTWSGSSYTHPAEVEFYGEIQK